MGLGIYFAAVGLDEADKLASVIAVFLALAGLGLAVCGIVARPGGRQEPSQAPADEGRPAASGTAADERADVQLRAEATGRGRVYQAGRDQHIQER
ncbi:hypothetical protein AB0B01_07330 [Streptomyces sp. NPDC044571]|uniref:hypothetical protein n=1 Tax=Streptomyces sp. NPDC044571 TaxID=3155371 RepID=UPI0033D318D0